ncbi:hypothetical protein HQN64_20430 [Enterobacteriaceae bacterium BIT-l23]|uniref:DUF7301 family protein n=1 Tax=Jejubacter sp. L23 TaxID=3092086 RepID=UPI001584CFA7|nr:hypothetical protein [Enterobacteriaceae bacterium BIT-l23]
MSTHRELFEADVAESRARFKKYYRSSSLPMREKFKHRPKDRKYRRDRVLHEIITRGMKYRISQIIDTVNGGESGKDAVQHRHHESVSAGGQGYQEQVEQTLTAVGIKVEAK